LITEVLLAVGEAGGVRIGVVLFLILDVLTTILIIPLGDHHHVRFAWLLSKQLLCVGVFASSVVYLNLLALVNLVALGLVSDELIVGLVNFL